MASFSVSFMNEDTSRQLRAALDTMLAESQAKLAGCSPGEDDFQLQFDVAQIFKARYDRFGHTDDLEEAINIWTSLKSTAHDHTVDILPHLANALLIRHDCNGNMADFDQAVLLFEQTLQFHPLGHSFHAAALQNLAAAMVRRHSYRHNSEDLNRAICMFERALKLIPAGNHSDRSAPCSNLALALMQRHDNTGNPAELDQSVYFHTQALLFCTPGNAIQPTLLSNLGTAMCRQGEMNNNALRLNTAIILHQIALHMRPKSHPQYGTHLAGLAKARFLRFRTNGNATDLNQAVISYKHLLALDLCSTNHFQHYNSLNNLAAVLFERYEHSGNIADLTQSVFLYKQALQMRPPGHTEHNMSLCNFARVMYAQYTNSKDIQSFAECIELLKKSANNPKCSAKDRLGLAITWANWAGAVYRGSALTTYPEVLINPYPVPALETYQDSALEACQVALVALEDVLLAAPTLIDHYRTLRTYDHLGVTATFWALSCDRKQTAAEVFEQSRALLWSWIRGFKVFPTSSEHADNTSLQSFWALTKEIEQLALSDHEIISHEDFNDQLGKMYQQKADLELRKQSLIEQIRLQPGYESFMKLPSFNSLKTVAAEGAIILLNCSHFHSDIVILYHDVVQRVLLLPGAFAEVQDISHKLSAKRKLLDEQPKLYSSFMAECMEKLWEFLVCPIVIVLEMMNVPQQSHIWWCPTSFMSGLPLHAAGPDPNSKRKEYFNDKYVSSYTVTLTALINARSNQCQTQAKSGSLSLLAIAQKDESLHCTNEEVSVLQNLPNVSFSSLSDADATTDRVTERLTDCSWVHFACHGELKDKEPFNAAFILHGDERLTLVDIIKANMPKAQFAFLSACHTAELTEGSASEEVLHLAAAMHFCGFPSVVGTLWQMHDADGPNLAREFYKHMLAEPTEKAPEVGLRRAARALNLATRALRKKHKVGIERWANFVHIGL